MYFNPFFHWPFEVCKDIVSLKWYSEKFYLAKNVDIIKEVANCERDSGLVCGHYKSLGLNSLSGGKPPFPSPIAKTSSCSVARYQSTQGLLLFNGGWGPRVATWRYFSEGELVCTLGKCRKRSWRYTWWKFYDWC